MENTIIPTAEDVMIPYFLYDYEDKDLIKSAMIEFAKLHVELALEEASEKADMLGQTQHNNNAPDEYTGFVYVTNPNGADYGYTVNKDSILKSYPLDLIK